MTKILTQTPFIRPATGTTPYISFHNETGIFEIAGRILPEDAPEFFIEVVRWVQQYSFCPHSSTTVSIVLEYVKTSSFKMLYDVFQILEKMDKSTGAVTINWYYEADDEEIKEMGNDYESAIDLKFNFIAINDN